MFLGSLRSRVGDWRTSGMMMIVALALVLGWSLNWWVHPRVVERIVYQWTDKFEPALGLSYRIQECRMVEVVNSGFTTGSQAGVLVELNLPQPEDSLLRWYPRLVYPNDHVIWVDELRDDAAVFYLAGDGTVKLLLGVPHPDGQLPDRTIAQFCIIDSDSRHLASGSE